ncbi:MAG: mannose-6-phosphate isomerase [Candidatus Glassbacteria bacterium]|nr:mannose-6-phosphate isomerase [Candidatus Glassbacteria bacterium]
MSDNPLYPMKLAPIFKDKIWGGRAMQDLLNKDLPDGLIGESWELSVYRDDITHPLNGPLRGVRLKQIYDDRPLELAGRAPGPGETFPLLTKFIDARRLLSVQVHPADNYAHEHDGENGKTECWYVVHADPGAELIRGLQPTVEPEAFRRALETSQGLETMVRRFKVSSGDFIFMPTGVVHAICENTVILEIEQNSDMTYRLNDWGRVGADGVPRPLHIDKGMDVIDFDYRSPDKITGISYHEGGNRITHMVSCRYFSAAILELESTFRLDTGGRSFAVLTVVEGAMNVTGEDGEEEVAAIKGDTVLVPAEPSGATLTPQRSCKVVMAWIDPTHKRFIEPLLRRGEKMDEIEKLIFR